MICHAVRLFMHGYSKRYEKSKENANTHTRISCVHIRIYVDLANMHVYMCLYMYVYPYVCIYICIYICVYMHTMILTYMYTHNYIYI